MRDDEADRRSAPEKLFPAPYVPERDLRAMKRTLLKSAWALAAVIVCLPAPALAQELRRDSVWNGVVAGWRVPMALGGSPVA